MSGKQAPLTAPVTKLRMRKGPHADAKPLPIGDLRHMAVLAVAPADRVAVGHNRGPGKRGDALRNGLELACGARGGIAFGALPHRGWDEHPRKQPPSSWPARHSR